MPLIIPYDLVVFLDLPADTQPSDRAQLVCDLVIDEIHRVAGRVLADPYPPGLKGVAVMAAARMYDNPSQVWSDRTDNVSAVYPGSRGGDGPSVLTPGEVDRVRGALSIGGAFSIAPSAPASRYGRVRVSEQQLALTHRHHLDPFHC